MELRYFVTFLFAFSFASSLNVLFINTWHSKSHARTMMYLAERLVSRGHNVSLYSMALYSLGQMGHGVNTLETIVEFPGSDEHWKQVIDLFWNGEMEPHLFFGPYNISYSYLLEAQNDVTFKRIMNTTYDVILLDEMFAAGPFAMASILQKKFGSKIGIFATTDLMPTVSELRGLGRNPVISPNYFTKGYRMEFDPTSFRHRLLNSIDYFIENLMYRNLLDYVVQRTGKILNVEDMTLANSLKMSLISFIDYPEHFNMPTTKSQTLIFTGEHCQATKPLSDEFKTFMEDPTSKGTILIAFGSILNWKLAPSDMKYKFLNVFNRFPEYRIIWSYTGEPMENVGKHIMFTSWAPQNDILAHNTTVLFLTHGGIKSFKEGLCAEVPMLFFPFFADQPKNSLIAKKRGIAECIYKKNITEIEIESKLRKLLTDKRYQQEISKLYSFYVDNVMEPLALGAFNVEKMSRMKEGVEKYLTIHGAHIGYIKYFYLDYLIIFTLGFASLIAANK